MPQFDVGFYASQLFWLAVVFSCLYFLVCKFIAPKAESILTSRAKSLEDNILYAEECNEKARGLYELKEEYLQDLDYRVEEMQKQALSVLETSFAEQRVQIEKEIEKEKKSAEKEIASYVKNFRADEVSTLNLASFIIEKITRKPVDSKVLQKIQGKKK